MNKFERAMAKHEEAIKPILAKKLPPFWETNEIRVLCGLEKLTMGQFILMEREYKIQNDVELLRK